MRDVHLLGVRVSTDSGGLVAYLQDATSARMVCLAVGAREGAAIASAQAGLVPARPATHDLALALVRAAGRDLVAVDILDAARGTPHALIRLDDGTPVEARPADAIALAVRARAPIRCAEALLGELDAEASTGGGEAPADADRELARFTAFLDRVAPEDFRPGITGQSHE